jgi:hypothetical protein
MRLGETMLTIFRLGLFVIAFGAIISLGHARNAKTSLPLPYGFYVQDPKHCEELDPNITYFHIDRDELSPGFELGCR